MPVAKARRRAEPPGPPTMARPRDARRHRRPSASHRGNLLGDQAHEEHDDAEHQQQHRAVGHLVLRCTRSMRRSATPEQRRPAALTGRKIAQRAEDRDHAQQDEEELHAVAREPDLRLADARAAPRWARTSRCSPPSRTRGSSWWASRSRWAAGGGTRAGTSRRAPRKPDVRSGIGALGQVAREPVERGVAERAARPRPAWRATARPRRGRTRRAARRAAARRSAGAGRRRRR